MSESINENLISWLNEILAIHISSDVFVASISDDEIILHIKNSPHIISIPRIPTLWKIGKQDLSHTDLILPAPGLEQAPESIITTMDKTHHVHYDILGLSFWMLSRAEEVSRTDLDQHHRFPAIASHAYEHGYLNRPIVDEWLLFLRNYLRSLDSNIPMTTRKFSTKVSHDVDEPSRYAFKSFKQLIRIMCGDLLKRFDVIGFLKAPFIKLLSRRKISSLDKMNRFDWLMDISDKHGFKSAFYFICGTTDRTKDADYSPYHPAIRSLIKNIHGRGHEIGMHASYNSCQDINALYKEKETLTKIMEQESIKQNVLGCRMHYLRWHHPETMIYLNEIGFAYDTTLGYADLPGFRCGTCHEYPAFDPVTMKKLNMTIRPLIAMECTIVSDQYMGLGTGAKALSKFQQLKDACKRVDGCFTLLWHNSHLWKKDMRALYEQVLKS